MRLWLRDSERKPDPVPVETDDRKAILVGLGLWVLGSIVVVIVIMTNPALLAPDAATTTLWTCAIGIALGVVGLAYTHHRHTRN
jgi:hypothetical protein